MSFNYSWLSNKIGLIMKSANILLEKFDQSVWDICEMQNTDQRKVWKSKNFTTKE